MDRLIKPDKTTGRPSKPAPGTIDEVAVPKQLSETLTLTPDTYASSVHRVRDTEPDTEVDMGNFVSPSPDTEPDMEEDTVYTAAETENVPDTGLNAADTRTHSGINTGNTETDTHISVADTRVGVHDTEPETHVSGADMTVGQPDAVGVSFLEDAHA